MDSEAAGDSGDTTGNVTTVSQILKDLQQGDISLIDKYVKQNQLKKIAKSGEGAFTSVKTSLETESGYVYRKLLLDCHLEASNVQYLVDLVSRAEDPTLIKYALTKYYWLFKHDTPFDDPEFFTQNLLPVMPYSIRNLILWKVAKNSTNPVNCEALYAAIDQRIGPSVANILLPACSTPFVATVLTKTQHHNLTFRQLSWLLKRHPSPAIAFLKLNASTYSSLLRRVIKIDPIAFADIFEEARNTQASLHFSPMDTKLLLRACFDRILAKAKVYSKILHEPTLFRLVGRESYIKFLVVALPETLEDFQNCSYAIVPIFDDWIHRLPVGVDKATLFKEAFEKCYGARLIDNLKCVSPSMLQIFSAEERNTLSELKLAEISAAASENSNGLSVSVQRAQWFACMSIDMALPALKGLIAKESDHFNRQQLLGYLIKACSINHDGSALNEVCKYYVDRHRNERQDTHARFISDITNEFDSKDLLLDQNALHYFVEIFKLYIMNLEKDNYIQISEDLLAKVYFAQVDNCLSTSWILPIIFKLKLHNIRSWSLSWLVQRDHVTEKYLSLMEIMVEHMETLPLKTLEEWARFVISVLTWSRDWNRLASKRCHRNNPKTKLPHNLNIKHFPNIEDKLAEIAEKLSEIPKYLTGSFVGTLLQDSAFRQDPSNPLLVKCLELFPSDALILHFLNHNVRVLTANWEVVTKYLFAFDYEKVVLRLRQNGYDWHLTQLKKAFDQRMLDNSLEGSEKVRMIGVASLTLPTDAFLTWVQQFSPKAAESSTSTHYPPETFLGLMAPRRGICQYLKNVEHPTRALGALLPFCAGEYLKMALSSLLTIVINSEFQTVEKFLLELCQCPAVSVKKHGIRLMTQISFKDGICKFLMDLWSKDEHSTTRSVILTEVLNRLDYDASAWGAFKGALDTLSVKDASCMALLWENRPLPDHLVEEYGSLVWRKYGQDGEKACHMGFVNNWMTSNFERLSAPWMLSFLGEEVIFLESELELKNREANGFMATVREAFATLLIRSLLRFPEYEAAFLDILNKNLRAVEPFLGNGALRTVGAVSGPVKMVVRFVKKLCQLSFEEEKVLEGEEVVRLLEAVGKFSMFSSQCPENFLSKFFLNLSRRMHAEGDRLTEVKGQVCGRVLDDAVAEYGPGIFPFWAKQFRSFVRDIWHPWDTEEVPEVDIKLDMAAGLLESSDLNLEQKMTLALTFVPELKPKDPASRVKYEGLLTKISGSDSFLVQIQLMDWAMGTE